MNLSYAFAGGEIVGKRENQEDFYLFNSSDTSGGMEPCSRADWVHIVIADGMGGHVGGEIASCQASVGFMRNLKDLKDNKSMKNHKRLENSLHVANERIRSWVITYPENNGMGCTLIGAIIEKNLLSWVSVGDSLLYLFRDGVLRKLNLDHSYASVLQEKVHSGEMTQEEANSHPQRNQLLTAVMGETLDLIDLPKQALKLKPKDRLLFATDGILSLTEEEISKFMSSILRSDLLEEYCQNILNLVTDKNRQEQDNTAVSIVYCAG